MKKGDVVATIAQPIARVLDWAFKTDIQNCPGCKKMQVNLNTGMSFTAAISERFFNKQKGENMKFMVNRQVAIEADSVEDAIEKTKPMEGTTSSIHVQPVSERPQVQPPRITTGSTQ